LTVYQTHLLQQGARVVDDGVGTLQAHLGGGSLEDGRVAKELLLREAGGGQEAEWCEVRR